LEPSVGVVHGGKAREERRSRLKFFRAEHGHDEIEERGDGDESDEEVFHGGWWRRRREDQRTFSQKTA
jgi:hypothetical protein